MTTKHDLSWGENFNNNKKLSAPGGGGSDLLTIINDIFLGHCPPQVSITHVYSQHIYTKKKIPSPKNKQVISPVQARKSPKKCS